LKPRDIAALMGLFLMFVLVIAYLGAPLIPEEYWKQAQWPAWVQAIGSVLAILVAVAVPYVQKISDQHSAKSATERV